MTIYTDGKESGNLAADATDAARQTVGSAIDSAESFLKSADAEAAADGAGSVLGQAVQWFADIVFPLLEIFLAGAYRVAGVDIHDLAPTAEIVAVAGPTALAAAALLFVLGRVVSALALAVAGIAAITWVVTG